MQSSGMFASRATVQLMQSAKLSIAAFRPLPYRNQAPSAESTCTSVNGTLVALFYHSVTFL